EFADEQRRRWRQAFVDLTPQLGQHEYGVLSSYATDWQQLAASLAAVRRHEDVHARFQSIFDGPLEVPPTLEAQIDEMLDSLVAKFDAEELPLRQREVELESI